jgi:hypothetical protein
MPELVNAPRAPDSRFSPSRLLDALEQAEPCGVHACYAHAVARGGRRPHGTIQVRLSIDSAGDVERATDAGGDFPAGEVRTCVVETLRVLPFATENHDVDVILPVYFTHMP